MSDILMVVSVILVCLIFMSINMIITLKEIKKINEKNNKKEEQADEKSNDIKFDNTISISKLLSMSSVSKAVDNIIVNAINTNTEDLVIDKVTSYISNLDDFIDGVDISNNDIIYIEMFIKNRINKIKNKNNIKFDNIKKSQISEYLNIDIDQNIVTSSDGGVHMMNMFDQDLSNFDNTQYEE